MKRFILAVISSVFLASPLFAIYNDFSQEPFLSLLQTRQLKQDETRFYLQHHFDKGDIASANIRFGYGITESADIYVSLLDHSQHISAGGLSASLKTMEYELLFLTPVIRNKDKTAKASLLAGASSLNASQDINGVSSSFTGQYILLSLLYDAYSKGPFIGECAPTVVNDTKNSKTASALTLGLKYKLSKKAALFAEIPLLLSNPDKRDNPYSAGLQFKLGPHMVTVFVTNTYGFTISDILLGTDTTYFGFRFSY